MSLVSCGPSKAQQQMSTLLTEYGQAVDKYAELNGNGDANAVADAKAKVKAIQTKWYSLQSDLEGEVTPQVMDKMDKEFKTITQKFENVPSSA